MLDPKKRQKFKNMVLSRKAADSMRKALTPEPVGANRPGKNWIEKSPLGHLPPYVQHVANELIKKGKTRSKAIEMAIGIVRNWSRGGQNAKPSTIAAANLAMGQWSGMKAWARGRRAAAATKSVEDVPELTDAELVEYLESGDVGLEEITAVVAEHGPTEAEAPEDTVELPVTDETTEVAQLSGPIARKDDYQRLVYAPVLVPGEPDVDDDRLTPQKIQEVAHDFLMNHRYMDEQHTLQDPVAVPVESYILPEDLHAEFAGKSMTVPKGSWMLGAKITNDATWNRIVRGELDGFSVMGVRKSDYETAVAASTKSAFGTFSVPARRITLRELGEDWIGAAVSVVKGPAVSKAKWIAVKSQELPANTNKNDSLWDRLRGRSAKDAASGNTNPEQITIPEGEELDVKITDEQLSKLIEDRLESALNRILDGEGGGSGESGDEGSAEQDTTITFDNPNQLDQYIDSRVNEILEAGGYVAGSGESDDAGAAEGASEGAEPVAAVKSLEDRIVRMEKLVGSRKSRQGGGGDGDENPSAGQSVNAQLNRDNFGRPITAR